MAKDSSKEKGKNKKTKVYLQFPWKFTDSPYYKYLLKDPPEQIEYTKSGKREGIIESKTKMLIYQKFKKIAKKTLRKTGFVKPNVKTVKSGNKYDLIHGAHCLINSDNPWIADFEHPGQFTIPPIRGKEKGKKKVRKILLDKNCKKILAWSENLKKWILKEYPEIENKIEVVYPAIPQSRDKRKKKENNENIKIIFVARDFEIKGGRIALEVLDKLTKKYDNVEGKIISNVPKELLEKYQHNDKIRFLGLVPQKELFEKIYPESNIFLYTSFSDTFGFAILEAQSFGLPVISMKTRSTHSIEETVQEGKTGLIINNEKANAENKTWNNSIIEEIQEKTQELVNNKKLREKMSRNCIKEIKEGKFSIKERNRKLKRIYQEALEK